ncbi:MAG: glycosyltransferase family 39 protein [Gemmatimonadaceae bacterium]
MTSIPLHKHKDHSLYALLHGGATQTRPDPISRMATSTTCRRVSQFGFSAAWGRQTVSALPILALSAIALAVRLAVGLRGGLWRDEALFLSITRLPSWAAMLDFLRFHESHPPLFYALMRLWILALGDTDGRSIALSVIFGVALVPVIYLVGKSLFSERIGLLAAAFAAVSPSLIEFSATVRPYSLMPLLALLSTYALIRGLQRGGVRVWIAGGSSTVALIYTHNWGWLVVVGQWISIGLLFCSATTRPSTPRLKEWFATQAAIGIAYLPWASTLVYQTEHAGHSRSLVPVLSEPIASVAISLPLFLKSTVLAYSSFDSVGSFAILFFTLPLGLLAVDQYLRTRDEKHRATAANAGTEREPLTEENRIAIVCLVSVPVAAWIVALILSSMSNLMLQRCLVTLAPLMLLAVAYRVGGPRRGEKRLVARVTALLLLLTYALGVYELFQTSRSNAREIAPAVALQTLPTDLVIVTPEWLASSFNRYYLPSAEQIDYPHFGREEEVDFSGMLQRFTDDSAAARVRERIREAREQSRRVWLIADREDQIVRSTADMRRFLESSDYGVVAFARTSQLHAELESLYGSPDTAIYVARLWPRYEAMRALLYAPHGDHGH